MDKHLLEQSKSILEYLQDSELTAAHPILF